MRTYILRKAPPLKPIGQARHIDDASCPDAGWKALTKNQKTRLAIMARKAAEVQGVSLKSKDLDEWRHGVCIKACGVRITEATQANWADLKSAFEDLGGKPEQAFKTQLREGDNKRRIAMHKLTGALAAKGLQTGYAETICKTQFKVSLAEASAKQLWCLFYTVTNRRK
jgi:hypothetical protein